MSIPARMHALASMLAIVALSSGCARIAMTASHSVSPVLVGPVKSLGGKPVAPPPGYADMCRYFLSPIEKGTPMTPLEVGERYSRMAKPFVVDMNSRKQSVATMHAASGMAGQSGSSQQTSSLMMDAGVVDATEGDYRRRVDVEWINCDGTMIILGFAGYDEVTCKARGLSLRTP